MLSRAKYTRFLPFLSLLASNSIASQIYYRNQKPSSGAAQPVHLSLQKVLGLVIDSFTHATERHVEVCFRLSVCMAT